MIRLVWLLPALMTMPPVPVLFELVMVVPPIVSELLLLKFSTSVLPSVRLLIVPLTFSCTVEADVVIKALLPEPGTVPNDQDAAVPQLPDPASQLSELIAGRTNGLKPKARVAKPFPKIIRRIAFCPSSLTGCLAGDSDGACAYRPAQANRKANKYMLTFEMRLLSRSWTVTMQSPQTGRRDARADTLTHLQTRVCSECR